MGWRLTEWIFFRIAWTLEYTFELVEWSDSLFPFLFSVKTEPREEKSVSPSTQSLLSSIH